MESALNPANWVSPWASRRGARDRVVESCAKAGLYGQRLGRLWGTVGDRDRRLAEWGGQLAGGLMAQPWAPTLNWEGGCLQGA